MKQISPDLHSAIRLDTLPTPRVGAGQVLSTAASLASAGTEQRVADFAKKSLLERHEVSLIVQDYGCNY